jgi:hypothetical protein
VNSFALSGTDKDNYNLLTTSATVTGIITAKQITLTLNGVPAIVKGYDATNTATLAAGNYSLQNIEIGDDVSVAGTATYNDAKAGINKAITVNSFALSGAQKDNYQLLTNTANIVGTITAKPLTLTLTNTPQITKEYDKSAGATLAAGNYVLTGIINSDAVSVTGTAAYDNDQVGTGKTITVNSFALSGTDKDNYTLPPATLTVTGNITAKPISLTLNASPLITRQYNKTTAATLATGNYTLNGVISGDAISATGTAAYDNDQIGTGKTITVNSIVLSGAQKDNYNLLTTTATVTGNITAKQITLTLNGVPPIVKGYDATNTATLAAGNYSLQNIESGDDVSVAGTATYADAKAGINKTITANSFVLSGAQKDNYQLLTNTANIVGTITAKPLTLTLTNTPQITKEYDKSAGATLTAGNYVLTGIINSDAVSVTGTAAYDNDQVGTGKTITVNSFALSGTDKDNYTLPPATLTVTGNITAKPISLTLNASPLITRQYNKTTAATLATGNYTLNGVISGDAISATGTAAYDNDQIGTGKTITVNSIVLSGAQKDNYNLLTTTATVTGNITAKQITLTLNGVPPIVKGYDATNTATLAAGNYSLQNIESGDDVSVAGTATYNDAKAGVNKTITVNSFVLSGAQKDNYQLLTNIANIVGTITAKPLTLTLTGTPQITKEYDKSTAAALAAGNYVLTGIINSDAVSVTGTAVYDNDQVGTGKTITVNSFALSGTDKDNYTLPPATLTVTGDITTKPISLTLNASPLISKTYDGNATATLQSGNYALSGIISGDNVSVTGTAAYDNAQAAVSKNITVNSLVLSGAQKDNYSLLTTTVNTTGDITAKAITVTADNTSKTYGDADPALTYTFSPVLIGGDAFSGALTRTAGENVGSYPVQQGTLSLPANYTVNQSLHQCQSSECNSGCEEQSIRRYRSCTDL